MTSAEQRDAARQLARELFLKTDATATLNIDDLTAAIASIDTAMDTVISTIPAGWQAKTIKAALADNLPNPYKSTATAQQKAMALALWAMKETGLL